MKKGGGGERRDLGGGEGRHEVLRGQSRDRGWRQSRYGVEAVQLWGGGQHRDMGGGTACRGWG